MLATRIWTPADQWLWSLSSQARFQPDASTISNFRDRQIRPSDQLRAAVSRDSLGLVALAQDVGDSDIRNFFNGAQFFVEGLYTDAMLLALAQRTLLSSIADEVQRTTEVGPSLETLGALEDRVLKFRREYWTTDFAPQGIHDEVISRYRQEHALDSLLEQVSRDLADYSRRVQSVATDTTNAVLGFLTIVGLPITIGLTAWQGYNSNRLVSLIVVAGISLLVAFSSLIHPTPRRLAKSIIRTLRPRR